MPAIPRRSSVTRRSGRGRCAPWPHAGRSCSYPAPILGAARVGRPLEDTAEWRETLERETVTRMNAGLALDHILAEVRPPAHLADRPYLQAVYDEPEYVVRNIWRLYGGWWDGQPAHLKPAGAAEIGLEVATLAGGAGALAERALALAERGRHALAWH